MERKSLSEYLTAEQLMQALSISRSTLLKWRKAGLFPKGLKIGRVIRWNVADVQDWIAHQATGATA